jgi:hypothetical protein
MRIDFQAPFDFAAPIADADLGGVKGALLLRILDGLRFENENAFLARALRARPTVTVRLYINDEPGAHVGI